MVAGWSRRLRGGRWRCFFSRSEGEGSGRRGEVETEGEPRKPGRFFVPVGSLALPLRSRRQQRERGRPRFPCCVEKEESGDDRKGERGERWKREGEQETQSRIGGRVAPASRQAKNEPEAGFLFVFLRSDAQRTSSASRPQGIPSALSRHEAPEENERERRNNEGGDGRWRPSGLIVESLSRSLSSSSSSSAIAGRRSTLAEREI